MQDRDPVSCTVWYFKGRCNTGSMWFLLEKGIIRLPEGCWKCWVWISLSARMTESKMTLGKIPSVVTYFCFKHLESTSSPCWCISCVWSSKQWRDTVTFQRQRVQGIVLTSCRHYECLTFQYAYKLNICKKSV